MTSLPVAWRNRDGHKVNAREVTRGYIRYFEPDAYVEAEDGLLEASGLDAFRRNHPIGARVLSLNGLMEKQYNREWAEPKFGLSMVDAMRDMYTRELRFEMKQSQSSLLVKPQTGSLLTEALFGCYPTGKLVDYFRANYRSVFAPQECAATPEAWLSAFKYGALTPLRFTRYKLEVGSTWRDGLTLFVFDPASSLDCIDLWNMRSESQSILPVPIDWWTKLLPELRSILRLEHRLISDNPHDVMHHGTIEFARSIPELRATTLVHEIARDLPQVALVTKLWRTPIWRSQERYRRTTDQGPLAIKSAEKRIMLPVDETTRRARFETLSPEFAEQYGSSDLRWVNTIDPSNFYTDHLATTLPFNTFDPYSAMSQSIGEPVMIGREGWSIGQGFKDLAGRLTIPSPESAVISALERYGIDARLSEPGHIAKQILGHLDGLWGVRLLADPETLDTLNTMAGGIRRKGNDDTETEELFDRRSKSIRDWQALIERRKKKGIVVDSLNEFTSRNVIRLGLQSNCPNCANLNWHSLTAVDYDVICERCQRDYAFPQAKLAKNNGNWSFRVVGPFAVPDYARGSYGALLALKAISNIHISHDSMAYATALALSFDGIEAEADFVALRSPVRHGVHRDPELIICEAKSFGTGPLITAKDLTKLRAIARKIKGAVIVISVLRDHFIPEELKLLAPFVKWCRRSDPNGEMRNPVILLTGHEAFSRFDIGLTWKELGGEHAKFEGFEHRDSLHAFADATQAIYLGLDPYHIEMQKNAWRSTRSRV